MTMIGLTRCVLRHRRLVVLIWLALTVAGALSVNSAVGAFSSQFSVPGREGFVANSQIIALLHSGGRGAPLLGVVTLPRGRRVGDPAVRTGIGALEARLRRVLAGGRTASYASTGSRAFVSADGRTTFVIGDPPPDTTGFGENAAAAKAATRALSGPLPAGLAGGRVQVTGIDALKGQTGGSGGAGVLLESLLGGLGALVVLAFVFASLLAFVPLVMAVASILSTFLVLWGVASVTSVSFIVEFLVALIGLGVAIDYSLLVVVRWREERDGGAGEEEAVVRAMATAGRAVVFSGTTVAIGLLALVVLPLPFLRSIGLAGMLIPLISVLVACTLLPVVLVSVGPRLDWPHRRREDRPSGPWTGWANRVVAARWPAALAAIAVLVALGIAATSLQPGQANVDTLSRQGPARVGLQALEASGIGPGALTPIEVLAPANRAAAVAAATGRVAGTHGAVAPASWQRAGRAVVDVFATADVSTAAGQATIDRVRAVAHQAGRGILVGGIGPENEDFVSAIYGNFPLMIGLIAVLTFILLARAFRSIVLPLKAVALNVVSVGAAWGVITLVWQEGHGSSALWGISATHAVSAWIPLMVFAFLFGLSMDYEVFILSRMREEYDATGSTDGAVVRGIARTGRLVTSAALILFLAFASMASAPDTDVKVFATGLAAGILLDATVIRALLVPALVSLFGRWNWWLPAGAARLLRVAPGRAPVPEAG
jgi:RND superfamily putative drug exporter